APDGESGSDERVERAGVRRMSDQAVDPAVDQLVRFMNRDLNGEESAQRENGRSTDDDTDEDQRDADPEHRLGHPGDWKLANRARGEDGGEQSDPSERVRTPIVR